MNVFRLDVERLTVQVATLDGGKKGITLFAPAPDALSGLADELEDTSLDFLPCRIDGRMTLIRKEWIAYLELEPDLPAWQALEEVGAIASRVELDLVTGETLAGTFMVEGSEYTHRVSDYLNRITGRFVALRTRSSALYVNRRAIARIRLEEQE